MQTREGNHMRKIHKVAGAVLGLTIGAVMGTGAADAAVTHHRHHHITVQPGGPIILTSIIGEHASAFLAGYQLAGNGGDRFRDVRALITVQNESGASPAVPADSLVAGFTQAVSINGGFQNGLGLVWDDPAGCGAGQWTLEAGEGTTSGPPMPLPASDLSPLIQFGAPVCLAAGSEFGEIYYNSKSHFVHFIAGPSQSATNTLADEPDGGYHNFYSGGFGVDTTNGTVASDLVSGLAGGLGAAAVTQYNGKQHALDSRNTEEWIGTVSGGSVSVSNPETLTPSVLGAGFAVTAP
jgi:hypothetical protein